MAVIKTIIPHKSPNTPPRSCCILFSIEPGVSTIVTLSNNLFGRPTPFKRSMKDCGVVSGYRGMGGRGEGFEYRKFLGLFSI